MPHFNSSDFVRALDLISEPDSPSPAKNHCCTRMTQAVNFRCLKHDDPSDCADQLLYYCAPFDEYGLLIHDGGSSYVLIAHCPWCGKSLPTPKRELWFETLSAMGFDEPMDQEIPDEFKTDAWHRRTT